MKAKTIRATLRKKINEWLATIEDEQVRELAARNTIVTGGAIASMLLREPVNDYDLYFRDYETTFRVARYYLKRFNPELKNGIPCRMFLADGNGLELDGEPNPAVGNDPVESRIRIIIKSAGIASEEGAATPYEYFEARPEGEARAMSAR